MGDEKFPAAIRKTPSMKSQHNEAEVPFGFDELFFSRTDKRGKICSGNSVLRADKQI